MARIKKWQSGSADLVEVAVGMVILSIAAAGTSAAMIYGREILHRQERYKVACYMVKREMEKKQWELESFPAARPRIPVHRLWLERTDLVTPNEFENGNQPVLIDLWVDEITPIPDADQPELTAYWTVSVSGEWWEPAMAGGSENRQLREQVRFTTAVYNQLD